MEGLLNELSFLFRVFKYTSKKRTIFLFIILLQYVIVVNR